MTLVVLAFVWLARRDETEGFDVPSIVPAFFIALTAAALFVDPAIGYGARSVYGAVFIVAMVAVAF